MLNSKGERELVYVAEITDIKPIEGYDRVELAIVNNGWTVVVGKDELKPGDLAVYFEIDSKLPEKEPYTNMEFLAKKHFKIKTQKMCKSLSQGLILSFEQLGLDKEKYKLGDFLTEELGVTYYIKEDNKRKGSSLDRYKLMAKHNPKLFSTPLFRWLMKRTWGRKFLFLIFGRKEYRKKSWPDWVVKTDEERVQNMTWILTDKSPWIVTEKIDGTSTTATVHKKRFGNGYDFYICSRNVVFDEPNKKCFYEENYYTKMAEKYHFKEMLIDYATKNNLEWVTLQGETYGNNVQKRDYHLDEQDFMGFNFITSKDGRWNSVDACNLMKEYDIPWVPILDTEFILPDTLEEILNYATAKSTLDDDLREGVVFRSLDGVKSFKAVSNEFLMQYHM